MARTYRWSDLRTGLVSLVAIVATAAFILIFARVGAIHGSTSSIYVLTDRATGVLVGTDVWLSGAKVGRVKSIQFRPVSTDTARRLALEVEIMSKRMPLLRRDARADIRPGGNLIGSPVVYISSGTIASPPLKAGDTLVTKSTGVISDVGTAITGLTTRLTTLVDSGGKTMALLHSEAGAVGAFTRYGMPRIANVSGTLSGMMTEARTGNGSAGLISRGDLGARMRKIAAATDSISILMSSGQGNIGRFRRDTTLHSTIARMQAEVDSLQAMMAGTTGTMARARSDTTLASEMTRIRAELAALMKDVKKHPLRYLSF